MAVLLKAVPSTEFHEERLARRSQALPDWAPPTPRTRENDGLDGGSGQANGSRESRRTSTKNDNLWTHGKWRLRRLGLPPVTPLKIGASHSVPREGSTLDRDRTATPEYGRSTSHGA